MGFLVRDAQLGQQVEQHIRLDLKLASQLIDTDFAHMMKPPRAAGSVLWGFNRFQSLPAGNLLCLRRVSIFYPNRFVFRSSFLGLVRDGFFRGLRFSHSRRVFRDS